MATLDLFPPPEPREAIGQNACVLHGFALPYVDELLPAIARIEAAAPFRQMVTPGGFTMSVALTNCGALGWTTDEGGYRYTTNDPESGRPWPQMPDALARVAREAMFDNFEPDACLVNRYLPGSRLG